MVFVGVFLVASLGPFFFGLGAAGILADHLFEIFAWVGAISGVLLATTIPHRRNEKDYSLLLKLEHMLSPYVAFGIMPLFALANAGVVLQGITFNSLLAPVPLGILCCLFIGKQIGVFLFHLFM